MTGPGRCWIRPWSSRCHVYRMPTRRNRVHCRPCNSDRGRGWRRLPLQPPDRGLGRDDWARQMLDQTLEQPLPRILDADALNLLALQPVQLGPRTVMTPHPAEAARLLGCSTAQVQRDRLLAVRQLAERFGCAAV